MDWLYGLPPEAWAWGPGFILGLLVLIGVYLIVRQALRALGGVFARLAETALSEFISAQKAQAEAMGRQATAMTDLAASVSVQTERSFSVHERMLLQLRVLHEDLDKIRELPPVIASLQAAIEALPCRAEPACTIDLRRKVLP